MIRALMSQALRDLATTHRAAGTLLAHTRPLSLDLGEDGCCERRARTKTAQARPSTQALTQRNRCVRRVRFRDSGWLAERWHSTYAVRRASAARPIPRVRVRWISRCRRVSCLNSAGPSRSSRHGCSLGESRARGLPATSIKPGRQGRHRTAGSSTPDQGPSRVVGQRARGVRPHANSRDAGAARKVGPPEDRSGPTTDRRTIRARRAHPSAEQGTLGRGPLAAHAAHHTATHHRATRRPPSETGVSRAARPPRHQCRACRIALERPAGAAQNGAPISASRPFRQSIHAMISES